MTAHTTHDNIPETTVSLPLTGALHPVLDRIRAEQGDPGLAVSQRYTYPFSSVTTYILGRPAHRQGQPHRHIHEDESGRDLLSVPWPWLVERFREGVRVKSPCTINPDVPGAQDHRLDFLPDGHVVTVDHHLDPPSHGPDDATGTATEPDTASGAAPARAWTTRGLDIDTMLSLRALGAPMPTCQLVALRLVAQQHLPLHTDRVN